MLDATQPARPVSEAPERRPSVALAPDLPHDLAAAIARLRDASAFFEQAQAQLRDATSLLQQLARQYGQADQDTVGFPVAQSSQAHGGTELRQALLLVTSAMQQIEPGTARVGGA